MSCLSTLHRTHPEDWHSATLITLTDQQLQEFLFSDEANFLLSGHVNSQNVRRYAPLRGTDPLGGRPDHFTVDKPTFSEKLMVFCGIRRDGTFGLKFYRNKNMDGRTYHSLLQYHVLPDLRQWNGWSLNRFVLLLIAQRLERLCASLVAQVQILAVSFRVS